MSVSDTTTEPETGDGGLRRVISRPMLTFFILGDILGAGIYSLTGEVGADAGGAIWLSFLIAFVLAFMTAFAYLELVTKYPQAAGAALYVDRAFAVKFVSFLVTFAVMGRASRRRPSRRAGSAAITSPACSASRTHRPPSSASSPSCWSRRSTCGAWPNRSGSTS